ncbi:hypothetical protein HK096_007552, partial [Nowakowskiella sp. JEL0078]
MAEAEDESLIAHKKVARWDLRLTQAFSALVLPLLSPIFSPVRSLLALLHPQLTRSSALSSALPSALPLGSVADLPDSASSSALPPSVSPSAVSQSVNISSAYASLDTSFGPTLSTASATLSKEFSLHSKSPSSSNSVTTHVLSTAEIPSTTLNTISSLAPQSIGIKDNPSIDFSSSSLSPLSSPQDSDRFRRSSAPSPSPVSLSLNLNGAIRKPRVPRFSILLDERKKRQHNALSKLVQKNIPGFREASRTGFRGSEREYEALVSYAERVFKASKSDESPKSRILDRPDSAINKDKSKGKENHMYEEESWLRNLRERIEDAMTGKPLKRRVEVDTPGYDAILRKEVELQKNIDKLRKDKDIFPPLTPEANKLVTNALKRRSGVLIDKFNIEIRRSDIGTLEDGKWLNDEVINFYGNMIMERSNSNKEKYPHIHIFNTFFYSTLEKSGYA